jgi:signal transduction histidine kinase
VLLDEHLHKVDRTDPQIKWFDALKLAEDSVEQIKAFSVEKNGAIPFFLSHFCIMFQFTVEHPGACPDIEIRSAIPASTSASTQTSDSAHKLQQLLGHPAHLHFMLIELLKNSCRAVLDRFGVLQAHSAPPIVLTVAANQSELVIRVSDQGMCCTELQCLMTCINET